MSDLVFVDNHDFDFLVLNGSSFEMLSSMLEEEEKR